MKMENIYKYVFRTKQTCYGRQYDKKNQKTMSYFFFLARVNFVMVSMNNLHTITFFWSLRDFFHFFFLKQNCTRKRNEDYLDVQIVLMILHRTKMTNF